MSSPLVSEVNVSLRSAILWQIVFTPLDHPFGFFYFKNKQTRENYFCNVDFYDRKKFESK
jgi:hypothetical protein